MPRDHIELILQHVATWPEAAHEELLASFNEIEAKYTGVYRLSDEDRIAVKRGLADVEAGRLVDDDDITALFNRHFG